MHPKAIENEYREQKSLFDVQTDEETDSQLEELREPKSIFDIETKMGGSDMIKLGLCDEPEKDGRETTGFWERQFQTEPTERQKRWDWAFGVVLPVICIYLDPFIFANHVSNDAAILGTYRPFAYTGTFISIMLMMAWLLWRERLGGYSAIFGGLFLVASAISLVLGILFFPFSVLGSFALIGVPGFTPLFTSLIFLRNAVRALRAAETSFKLSKLIPAAMVGVLSGLTVPYVLQVRVNNSLDALAGASPETIRSEGSTLRTLSPLVDPGKVWQLYYDSPTHSPERSELKNLYYALTGHSPSKYD